MLKLIDKITNKYLLSLNYISSPKFFKKLFFLVIVLQLGLAIIGLQLEALDLRLGFTAQDALALFMQLTPYQRWTYLLLNAFDYVYILSYSLLLASLMFICYRTRFKKTTLVGFCLLPLVLGSLDYVETLCISLQIFIWPSFQPAIMELSGLANIGKWILLVINFFIVLIGLGMQLGVALREKHK